MIAGIGNERGHQNQEQPAVLAPFLGYGHMVFIVIGNEDVAAVGGILLVGVQKRAVALKAQANFKIAVPVYGVAPANHGIFKQVNGKIGIKIKFPVEPFHKGIHLPLSRPIQYTRAAKILQTKEWKACGKNAMLA